MKIPANAPSLFLSGVHEPLTRALQVSSQLHGVGCDTGLQRDTFQHTPVSCREILGLGN